MLASRFESLPVDVFVIGGGINGCGIARDLAGRGLSVTLAEMGDLAQATSSASTKLFHGGLRYLEYFEFGLVAKALKEITIHFERIDGQNTTFLNGRNVEREIREMRISEHVSPVSTIPAVRKALVQQQKLMGQKRGIVMDGRDIGTVVFADAELKIFLIADADVRTSRRHLEMASKGIDGHWEEIRHNLLERDRIDSTRADSPLRQAADAVVIDNTLLSEVEQLEEALALAKERGA